MLRRTFLTTTGLVALSGCSRLDGRALVDGIAGDSADEPPFAFENVTSESGLDYSGGAEEPRYKGMVTNAGVYAVDYDNDGWEDVLAIGSDRPVLFRNTGGSFERSDALPPLDSSFETALFFDYDNDGWDDLLLLAKGRTPLFLENDEGEFREASIGFDKPLDVPIGASAADFSGDGYPDVFIIQNGDWHASLPKGLHTYDVADGEDNGNPNLLYRGDGDGFTDVTAEAGIEGERWSLATSFVDLTDDGRPDIHVANDFNRDVIYLNNADETFERVDLDDRTNRNGMSSEVADFTGDGRLDIFVTNIWYPQTIKNVSGGTMTDRSAGNNLLVNRGNATFEDRGESFSVERGGWGWAAAAVDFDNDTTLDLVHATQQLTFDDQRRRVSNEKIREIHERHPFYRYPAVWKGTGDGFEALDPDSVGFEAIDGRGIAHLDYNNDGKADLVIGNATGTFELYENVGSTGKAVQVDIRGTETTPSLGARVTVSVDARTMLNVRDSKSDFLSQSTRILHFGVGDHETADIAVSWPDGTSRTFQGVETNQRLVVTPDGIDRAIDLDGDR